MSGDTKKSSFEDNMKRIEAIVTALEKGDLPLDQALSQFEEGVSLVKLSSEQLDAAEQKVFKLLKTDEGYQAAPVDEKEMG